MVNIGYKYTCNDKMPHTNGQCWQKNTSNYSYLLFLGTDEAPLLAAGCFSWKYVVTCGPSNTRNEYYTAIYEGKYNNNITKIG